MHEIIVIGSGPAGVSVSQALLERGHHVTMLDAGKTLEPKTKIFLDKIKNDGLLNKKNRHLYCRVDTKKNKLSYGSNYIYEDVENFFQYRAENCYFYPSFAQGGLSNVWGGVLASYSEKELADWPVVCRNLSSYYHRVISFFGDFYTSDTELFLGRQAKYLKNIWDVNQAQLAEKKIFFNAPKIAVNFKKCTRCGLCQYGCPDQLIYYSGIHLDLLKKNKNFYYMPNWIIENFYENEHCVESTIKNINNSKTDLLFSKKIFIACGAGLSSMLYLQSLKKNGAFLTLKDSQHFILPCTTKKFRHISRDSLHALCQLTMKLGQENISVFPVYLQFYTYMERYHQEIKNRLNFLYFLLKPILTSIIEHLIVAQGYLDPRESNELMIQYHSQKKFLITPNKIVSVSNIIARTISYLKKNSNLLAFKPLGFLLSKSSTGQSNHLFGSLPMSESPADNEVNIWGIPKHFKRVHFVDGSILPSVPAGPITLTIMANAYRIGKECPL